MNHNEYLHNLPRIPLYDHVGVHARKGVHVHLHVYDHDHDHVHGHDDLLCHGDDDEIRDHLFSSFTFLFN